MNSLPGQLKLEVHSQRWETNLPKLLLTITLKLLMERASRITPYILGRVGVEWVHRKRDCSLTVRCISHC